MSRKHHPGEHPHPGLLERFMRNEAEPAERRWVVRHLIAGCSQCLAVTSRIWSLADAPLDDPAEGETSGSRRQAAGDLDRGYFEAESAPIGGTSRGHRRRERRRPVEMPPAADGLVARLGAAGAPPAGAGHGDGCGGGDEAGRRGARLQAELLADELLAAAPAPRAVLLERFRAGGAAWPATGGGAGGDLLAPAVCEALLGRSRRAAATDLGLARQAAELALAVAEGLHAATRGHAAPLVLQVRAWAHLSQARRLGNDLDGAEWALAMAEALACDLGPPGERPAALAPADWAELLVFKAGLFADRGELAGAERLLERAAELFRTGAEPHRAGRALVQQGLLRAELGERASAVETLRAGLGLLDAASEPDLVAASLYRLAALLRGVAVDDSVAPAEPAPAAPAPAQTDDMSSRSVRGSEALELVKRARTIYRGLEDAVAEALLWRLQGQIEAALGELDEAEATLRGAVAALARHGMGREATLAQIELARILEQQGRAPEVHQLLDDRRPILQALDKSWWWFSGLLVFNCIREPADRREAAILGAVARFLAPRQPQAPDLSPDRRFARVA
jgi:tetratricopeptide (TPR) repeat protein